jgi:hypothetical protein
VLIRGVKIEMLFNFILRCHGCRAFNKVVPADKHLTFHQKSSQRAS